MMLLYPARRGSIMNLRNGTPPDAKRPMEQRKGMEAVKGYSLALGFSNTVDYELVWDAKRLQSLVDAHGITMDALGDRTPIRSLRDLLCSILFHMKNGTGCGLFAEDQAVLDAFAAGFAYKVTLGGTAVRAAIALAKLDVRSLVHLVSINEDTLRELPEQVEWVCGRKDFTHSPHIVLQYPQGAEMLVEGTRLQAPQANRVIYTSDADNARLNIAPDFFSRLAGCRALVLSSFDIIQNADVLADRLAIVSHHLLGLPDNVAVIYEDAHFAHRDFPAMISRRLLPFVDIHSMNEDEFAFYAGRTVDLLRPEDVWEALCGVRTLLPVPYLVVHTKHWALACGRNAESLSRALDSGNALAGARYAMGDAFTAVDFRAVANGPRKKEAEAFAARIQAVSGGDVCCRPAYAVSAREVTTIGLGDSFVGGFLLPFVP